MNGNPKLIVKNDGLNITNLGKTYSKKPVVRSVSLKIQRGEAVGLLGPNGAGKTTCFYMICGLITPDYGRIKLNDKDITDTPIHKRAKAGIGYLPQEISIFRGMTVEQNIRAILALNISDRREREIHLEELLAEFSLTHLRRASSLSLSGGERRKVEIARTLAMQPSFILLDEPLAGIDPIAIEEIRELIKHIKDRGVGVLITDHNVKETLELIDRALSINSSVSFTLWSVIRTPTPLSFMCFISSLISSIAIGSIPARGSSKRINEGCIAKVLAISTFLLSPPESDKLEALLKCVRENSASSSSKCISLSLLSEIFSARIALIFCSTVIPLKIDISWGR